MRNAGVTLPSVGRVAQRLGHLPPEQKVHGSNPCSVDSFTSFFLHPRTPFCCEQQHTARGIFCFVCFVVEFVFVWCGKKKEWLQRPRRGLNPRPIDSKSIALPLRYEVKAFLDTHILQIRQLPLYCTVTVVW